MAKRQNGKNKISSDQTLISIPVYISDMLPMDKDKEVLFPYTPEVMIDGAKSKIDTFNSSPNHHLIEDNRSTSPIKHGISAIEVIDLDFNNDKCLLLRVAAYQTNLMDGYYIDSSNSDEHQFNTNDKICYNTYNIILYPKVFKNVLKGKHAAYWHVFLYLDPLKDSKIMSKLARHIMSKIINSPIRNVKSEKFLHDIRNTPQFTKVEISLHTFNEGEESEPDYVTKYKYESKIKRLKTLTLYNVKSKDALSALEDTSCVCQNSRRTLRFETQEHRVLSSVQEFKDKLSHTFEDSFNYSIPVLLSDVSSKKIFDIDFIKEKMQGLFTRYLIPDNYVD